MLLNTSRLSDRDRAEGLVERNLKSNPDSVEDQLLKATILAVGPGRHGESVKILEQLGGANRLDANQRFLLAQLYLGERNEEKYQSEMLKLLSLKSRSPQHLAHFVNYWIDRKQLDQADRWLAELKKAEPQGVAALELEARLLDLRKRKPELLALLEARGRAVPDQIGPVADLLNRYGFAKEAEAAYKAFVVRDPKQPERVLALAQFLARQDRVSEAMEILKKAWTTCRPERVGRRCTGLRCSFGRRGPAAPRWNPGRRRPCCMDRFGFTPQPNWGQSGSAKVGSAKRESVACRRVLASNPENNEAA